MTPKSYKIRYKFACKTFKTEQTLEEELRQAHSSYDLPQKKYPEFSLESNDYITQIFTLKSLSSKFGGMLGEIIACEESEDLEILKKTDPKIEIIRLEKGLHIIKIRIYFLIKDNHVAYLSTKKYNPSILEKYIDYFLKEQNVITHNNKIHLEEKLENKEGLYEFPAHSADIILSPKKGEKNLLTHSKKRTYLDISIKDLLTLLSGNEQYIKQLDQRGIFDTISATLHLTGLHQLTPEQLQTLLRGVSEDNITLKSGDGARTYSFIKLYKEINIPEDKIKNTKIMNSEYIECILKEALLKWGEEGKIDIPPLS